MVSYKDATTEQITEVLKTYMDPDYYILNDFTTIIKRAKIIPERNIVEFKLAMLDLYLDTRDLSYVDAHPYNNI